MGAPGALSIDAPVSSVASSSPPTITHERGVAGRVTSWQFPPGMSVLLKPVMVRTFRLQRDAHTGSLQHARDGARGAEDLGPRLAEPLEHFDTVPVDEADAGQIE